ncbi:MAG TPA: mechanosensitive ion channel [Alphaproteobacteria bacterium]|nr:mechanosensitive ion channel [Micavibrio sp.]MBK9562819.1 mechanosensitive ion channel [Micavibrio sp.]HQX28252.1 mechanosensitive ion channel [Alphaproteobacteria bacterium]
MEPTTTSDFSQISYNISEWLSANLLTTDTFIQLIMIASAFLFGAILYRMIRGRILAAIDRAEMPIRIKRTITSLQELLMPLLALAVLFVMSMLARSDVIGMESPLNDGAMKLLLAWIVIRFALEFVENSFVRNIMTVLILTIAALSVFGMLDETTAALDAIGFSFGKVRFSALALIKGAMSIFILLYLALFASTFLERRVLKSKSLTRSSQVLIVKVMRVVLIVFAILVGVTSSGIDLSIFTVFMGTVGLGVGFGLQKVVSNLFSGMLLLMDKSISPGDIIELENTGTYGWVNHMAARYTEIVTRDNKSYLIPNEDFITQRVINWSHGNRLLRLDVKFGVHSDSNPHEVVKLAVKAAKKPARVVETPEPTCNLAEFGESSLNFGLSFWIKDAEQGLGNVKGEVLLALWDAFKANGIRIPYPHREIYMHKAD